MQLTDRRIYLTWEDARRREGIPLYEDKESALEPSFRGTLSMTELYPEPCGHPLSDVAIARDVPPAHKIIFYFCLGCQIHGRTSPSAALTLV